MDCVVAGESKMCIYTKRKERTKWQCEEKETEQRKKEGKRKRESRMGRKCKCWRMMSNVGMEKWKEICESATDGRTSLRGGGGRLENKLRKFIFVLGRDCCCGAEERSENSKSSYHINGGDKTPFPPPNLISEKISTITTPTDRIHHHQHQKQHFTDEQKKRKERKGIHYV